MRILAAIAGVVIGYAVTSMLIASGNPPSEPRKVDTTTCLECELSRYESHGDDRELVCWKSPATGGRVVRPSGWCHDAR